MILDCVHIMVNGDLLHCTGTVWCGVVTLFIMRAPRKISPFHLHMERWYIYIIDHYIIYHLYGKTLAHH